MENITTIVLSIISIILSLFNFVYILFTSWKKFDIQVDNYSSFNLKQGVFYEMNIQVINKSRLPISINEINIENNGNFTFIKSPRRILTSTVECGGQKETKKMFSSTFPLNIPGLSSCRYTIVLYAPKDLEKADIVKMNVVTNRGRIIQKSVLLKSKYLLPEEFARELSHFEELFI